MVNRNVDSLEQNTHLDMAKDIQEAIDEVKLMRQGKLPEKSAMEFLSEL